MAYEAFDPIGNAMDEAWRRVKFNHLKGDANAARSVLAHTFSLWPDKASEILSVSLTVF